MDTIAKHITELLYHHDCVILPDFGGFISNYHSAKIDTHRKLIHPPTKNVLFNKHVKVNDGLLASKLVKEESISYERAIKELTKFTNRIKKQINSGERVSLDKVGVLYLDKENNIQFNQDATNFLTSSFGLPSVDLIPIEKQAIKVPEKKESKEPKVVAIDPAPKKQQSAPVRKLHPRTTPYKEPAAKKVDQSNEKRRGLAFWAAAVLIPILLLYGVLTGYNGFKDGNGFNTASFNPLTWFVGSDSVFSEEPNTIAEEVHTPVEVENEIPTVPEEISSVQMDSEIPADTVAVEPVMAESEFETVDDLVDLDTAVAESTYVAPEPEEKIRYRYYLIGGCFSKEKYASGFIEDMIDEGFEAEELDIHKGLHRISLGGTDSRREIRKLRKLAKEKDISCWVLKF